MILCGSLPVPRNAKTVQYLIASRMLPPEAQLPDSLYHDPSSIYSQWFKSLPEQIKDVILPYLSNCNLTDQLKEVGRGGVLMFPSKLPVHQKFQLSLGVSRIQKSNSHQHPGLTRPRFTESY